MQPVEVIQSFVSKSVESLKSHSENEEVHFTKDRMSNIESIVNENSDYLNEAQIGKLLSDFLKKNFTECFDLYNMEVLHESTYLLWNLIDIIEDKDLREMMVGAIQSEQDFETWKTFILHMNDAS